MAAAEEESYGMEMGSDALVGPADPLVQVGGVRVGGTGHHRCCPLPFPGVALLPALVRGIDRALDTVRKEAEGRCCHPRGPILHVPAFV